MAKSPRKILEEVRNSPKNVRFEDLVRLAEAFGFEHARTSGSHQIYVHPDVPEPLNL
jgi:hypothetical protein